ncbi:unnamed protein product [Boreogadus saida]
MAQPAGVGVALAQQDTLAVPPMPKHAGLNEDLVKILRENLLQPDRPRGHRRSPSSISPRLSPRNSPRLLRRMLLNNNNTHKQRRFTVAHTWLINEDQIARTALPSSPSLLLLFPVNSCLPAVFAY